MSADVAAEEMLKVQKDLREAAEKLQTLKDKAAGRTRMSREQWDSFSGHQRELLSEAVVKGQVIIEDFIEEETWKN